MLAPLRKASSLGYKIPHGATAALAEGIASSAFAVRIFGDLARQTAVVTLVAVVLATVAFAVASRIVDVSSVQRQDSDREAAETTKNGHVGVWLFLLAAAYTTMLAVLDPIKHRKFVMSENALRHLLGGLTFSAGCTIAYAIWDTSYFAIVAPMG